MQEMRYDYKLDFGLSEQVEHDLLNTFHKKQYAIGICSISGDATISQWREPMICDMVKPSHQWFVHQGIFPDLQKNQAVKEFLEEKHLTHMLFIDRDTIPKDRLCLAKLILSKKPVISGIQAFKTYPTLWSVGVPIDHKSKKLEVRWVEGHETSDKPETAPWDFNKTYRNRIQKALVCGNGFLLVERSVFEKLHFPWFATGYTGDRKNWGFQGEDFSFSANCFKHKIPIYAHWGVKTEHQDGRIWYPMDFVLEDEEDEDTESVNGNAA